MALSSGQMTNTAQAVDYEIDSMQIKLCCHAKMAITNKYSLIYVSKKQLV